MITTIFEKCSLNNFTDDNTLDAHASSVTELVNSLEKNFQNAIDWFKINHMIANPEKFKVIMINKQGKDICGIELNINEDKIYTQKEVELLGISINFQLSYAKWLQIN